MTEDETDRIVDAIKALTRTVLVVGVVIGYLLWHIHGDLSEVGRQLGMSW